MSRAAHFAVTILLIAVALAGCTSPPQTDNRSANNSTDIADVPPAPHACQTGWNFTEDLFAYSKNNPVTLRKTYCWRNGNQTNRSVEPFYYNMFREKRSSGLTQGEWEVTVLDADDDVFFHRVFKPGGNRACNNEGRNATPGNWTIDLQLRNFTGDLGLRFWIDHPPEGLDCTTPY